MDQLDILQSFETALQRFESEVNKKYTALNKTTQNAYTDHVKRYGESLAEAVKYNRLEQLKKQVDQAATSTYSEMVTDVQQLNEEQFNEMYYAYVYLLYASMSDEEGEHLPITKTFVKTSVAVAIAYYLLQNRIKFWNQLQKEVGDLVDVFTKHKNDYVYNVMQDIREGMLHERGYQDTNERIQKRTLNARLYGFNRIDDVTNYLANFVQDKVYDAVKTYTNKPDTKTKLEKMWVSMRDNAVRFAHRILDSQMADKEGYFHYGGDKAKRPKTWKDQNMNWGCRCKIILILNGRLPRSTEVSDYQDKEYQVKLTKRIKALQKDGKTYIQAYRIADKEIKPPRRKVKGYMTYEKWLERYKD